MNFQKLYNYMDEITAWRIPGADCAVYINNKPVARYTCGYSDIKNKTSLSPNALYHIYSSTKLSTCIAGLKLFEQGKFSMSDPLYEYIPEYKDVYLQDGTRAKNAITIKDLFTMTSGITHEIHCPSIMLARRQYGKAITTLEAVRALANEPLYFEPSTYWHYGLSHDVLAAVIEIISGKRFADFAKENIFIPLGMKDTSFHLTDENREKMCPRYYYDEQADTYTPVSLTNNFELGPMYDSGGAGIISSVEDYIKLASALANGGLAPNGAQLLKPSTIDMMRTNQLSDSVIKGFIWPHMTEYGYGYGVRTMLTPSLTGAKSPLGEFGWGGAAGSFLLADPDNHLAIYYCQHMMPDFEEIVHPRIRDIVYECITATY